LWFKVVLEYMKARLPLGWSMGARVRRRTHTHTPRRLAFLAG